MRSAIVPLVVVAVLSSGCAGRRVAPDLRPPAAAGAVVADPDRTAEDRALDAGRHPAALLELAGIRPGMRVFELAAGGGYTAELLARAVGPTGRVWAQNNTFILERFAEKPLSARLQKPVMANVTRVDRDFERPFPPDARDLDVVVINLFYHDLYWFGVDREAMNRAVWDHLRPGGRYVVIDHTARPGSGTADVQTLHRVEESVVRKEIEPVGFRVAATSDVWRVPSDTLDWSTSPRTAGERRGTSDRWAVVFEKPVRARSE